MRGTVVRICADRGFGFITARDSDSGRDYFFHVRDTDMSLPFDDSLTERDVEFDTTTKDGRPRAINVRPAN